MIKIEEIRKLIEDQKGQCKADEGKEIHLSQLIQDAVSQLTLAIDDGYEEEANRLHGEIKRLKEELAQVEDLNAAKDSGAFEATLNTKSKLPKLCKEFEKQQMELADALLVEEEAAAAKVTNAKDTLIESVKEMRRIRQEIADTVSPLDSIKNYTPDALYAPNGSTYEAYQGKMTQFNFTSISENIKRAGGVRY